MIQQSVIKGLTVVIPSYKRAEALAGADYFGYASVVVPQSQAKAYESAVGKKRVIAIPDDADGSIPKKRNWILSNLPRPLLMIDDDVRGLMMSESNTFRESTRMRIELSPEEAEKVIVEGFVLARDWGCKLWGLNVNTDPRNYQQYKPFSLTRITLGPFQGHWDHPLRFDERVGTKDDYDMALQHLQRYGKILRMNKYAYDCDHGDNAGGIVSQRTLDIETEYCRVIERKWGRGVIRYPEKPKKMGDLLNGRVSIPIKGV